MVRLRGVPAAFWRRIVAYIVDSFLISFIILTPFSSGFESEFSGTSLTEIWSSLGDVWTGDVIALSLFISILILAYWSVLEWKFGQTLGKILLRIKVQGMRQKPITFYQALVRSVTKLSTLLLAFDVLYMLIKKGNQRYFEVMSTTVVVEERAKI
jgi:uncharacterized RDD family membrane protein YckC